MESPNVTTSPDIIVVGAGPNGLSAGIALAQHGLRVHLYEANETVGGGARTAELTIPGFHHDVCSAVHPMCVISPFFRTLPLVENGVHWIHPPILMAHPFDDGSVAVLASTTIGTADSLGQEDGPAYRRFMDPFVQHSRKLIGEIMQPPLSVPRHPLLMARLGLFGLPPAQLTARYWFKRDRSRAFFLGIAAHTLLPMEHPLTASFGIVLALAGHVGGWPIARGGSQAISNALASIFKSYGGEIHLGTPVRSLGEFVRSRAIVLDLTPRQVVSVAGDSLPSRYREQLRAFRYGPGVFKMDWALNGPIPWTAVDCRRAGTIHLGASAAEISESASAAWHGRRDDNPFVILVQPSLFDATRCPRDHHTAWAYCHVPHGSIEDRTAVIEKKIERFAPGFRDLIVARNSINTRQLETRNENMVGGDINGGVQDLAQFLFRPAVRLDPYSTPLDQLFLCSASTPPGGAVHGMCGYNAALSVLRRLSKR
jgi:phytoene dehydrogenase-like protein